MAPQRFYLALSSRLSVTGIALAMIALYGLVSFITVQRTREIGLRMALGATRAQVVWIVLRASLYPALTGIAGGAFAALLLGRWVRAGLFGIAPYDPLTFLTVAGVVLLVAPCAGALRGARRYVSA